MTHKNRYQWFLPIITVFMFITLFAAVLRQSNPLTMVELLALTSGIYSYVLLLMIAFISTPLKWLRKKITEEHQEDILTGFFVLLFVFVAVHLLSRLAIPTLILDSISSILGYISLVLLVTIVLLAMIFSPQSFGIARNKFKKITSSRFSHFIDLWMSRVVVIATLVAYFHITLIPLYNQNNLFMMLINLYSLIILGVYAFKTFQSYTTPKYKLTDRTRITAQHYLITTQSNDSQLNQYQPGDILNVRFKQGNKIVTDNPLKAYTLPDSFVGNQLRFIVKDPTPEQVIQNSVSLGDNVILEGSNQNETSKVLKNPDQSLYLFAAGSGIFSGVSLIEQLLYHEKSEQPITLIWSLPSEKDIYLLDALNTLKETFLNFDYRIILTNEQTAQYDYGFIDATYLEQLLNTDDLDTVSFMISGPKVFVQATETFLHQMNVPENHIFTEY